jgi:glycosyltransferase involved in cell wall biosynthesis
MQNNKFLLNLPFNQTSFGNVSFAIARELKARNQNPFISPIGVFDGSTQKHDDEFNYWIQGGVQNTLKYYSREYPSLRLWHINGSLESFSSRGNDLITFFELDQLTPSEINILKNQRKVYVTAKYTQSVFKQYGIDSIYLPLGFDSYNFHKLPRNQKIDGEISFLLLGKLEHRKNHFDILRLWAKKYGNKLGYKLNCAIANPFLKPEDFNRLIVQILEGKQYWNINFLPWSETNEKYNSVLQSSDIVFALSGAEGFDLPVYHAVAMGAWPLALNAHVYTDYLNPGNAIFINPNGKKPAYDGMFFAPNQPFNQGNIFTFSEEDFNNGCNEVVNKVRAVGENINGLELQKQNYKHTVDIILEELNK